MGIHDVLPGTEFEVFSALLKPTSVTELAMLAGRVALHLDSLEEQAFSFEFLDLELARRVAQGLCELIDGADGFDVEERSLLRGAVDYFLLSTDADHDVSSPIGLEDDARVFNSVCGVLGRADLVIQLAG